MLGKRLPILSVMSDNHLLILNSDSLHKLVNREDALQAVEEAMLLYESKDYHMPDRLHIDKGENTLLYMPSLAGDYAATKLISVYPENREKGMPVIIGTVVLNDGTTGRPLAIMDASTVTCMRTGAIAGVASRYLSPEDTHTLGVIGTGVQGTEGALSICHARPIKKIYAFNRSQPNLLRFQEAISQVSTDIEVILSSSSKEVLQSTPLLLTATNSPYPVLPNDPGLFEDTCIIALGSYKPDMQELPDSLFSLVETLFIDVHRGLEESGDLKKPLEQGGIQNDQISTLGKLIQEQQRLTAKTRVFKSVGMSLFDLTLAKFAYKKAIQLGLGEKVAF